MQFLPQSIILILGILPVTAWAQPRSAEQFISACRAAIQEKRPEKLSALFYTVGMTDSDKDAAKRGQQGMFGAGEIESISLEPLPVDFQSIYIMRGKKVEPTYPPAGLIKIKYKGSAKGPGSASVSYAVINGQYFLVSTKSTDLRWSGPPDKSIGFMVMGKGQDKVQIKAKWNASGIDQEHNSKSPSASFWGQYFEKITVTSTEEDTDVTLTVLENGEKIFVSERLKGKGTIDYKRKS
jgi:hypothetical protein